jgi:Domain of unknown function (DUF4091)
MPAIRLLDDRFWSQTILSRILAAIYVLVPVCANLGLSYAAIPQQKFEVWAMNSLERIAPDLQASFRATDTKIKMFAAKGESESAQIAVRASGRNLKNISLSISDLQGAKGKIAKSNLTLYREHFASVKPSNVSACLGGDPARCSLGAGVYPDGLIPVRHPDTGAELKGNLQANGYNLAAGKNAVYWLDVFVPRGTAAGAYQGTVKVTSDRGNVSIPISLKVWNFTLPLKPSLKTAFQIWTVQNQANELELLKHRLNPTYPRNPQAELMYAKSHGMNIVGDRGAGDASVMWGTCEVSPLRAAPPVSKFREIAARHPAKIPTFIYSADEVEPKYCPNMTTKVSPILRQWGHNIHQAGLKHLVVMPPHSSLYDDGTGRSAVDIWVVSARTHTPHKPEVDFVRSHHKGEVWSYSAMALDNYSPKWLIDYPPIDYRVHAGFINASLGMTGLLYWRVDDWQMSDPWNDPNHKIKGEFYPGDGMLFYPGDRVGLPKDRMVPSLRVKALRDGVEDFEYVQMLKRLGKGKLALELSKTAGADWQNWTLDPQVLAATRIKLGNAIEKLQPPAP